MPNHKGNSTKDKNNDLVHLESVKIDNQSTIEERLQAYRNQIKNPYCFICDGAEVSVKYSSSENTLQNLLIHILRSHQD